MIRNIKLSKRASNKLGALLDYLESDWSVNVKNEFIKKLDKSLLLIRNNPDSFQNSMSVKGLYRCLVTKQTTLFYRYDDRYIYIVTLFDNRQNPKRLNKEI